MSAERSAPRKRALEARRARLLHQWDHASGQLDELTLRMDAIRDELRVIQRALGEPVDLVAVLS